MKSFTQIVALLPSEVARDYDHLQVASDHYERMKNAHAADGPSLVQQAGYTYAGIRVTPNPIIPDGFAIVMNRDKPIGVIDFAAGTVTLVKRGQG